MAQLEDELGDITAKARRGLGYSIEKLAAMTGITPEDVRRIENYELVPDNDTLQSLAKALALAPDKLMDIADDRWQPEALIIVEHDILIEQVSVPFGGYIENCYLFADRSTSVAAIVDPGGSVEEILRKMSRLSLIPELVLITHTHADHTAGLREIVEAHPGIRVAGRAIEGVCPEESRCRHLDDGAVITVGDLTVTAVHTPGHTPDSVCYIVGGTVFTGDTLFAGSIGRPTSSDVYEGMLQSIRDNILTLPDNTVILPGHGPSSTVFEETQHNPFF